MERPKKRTKGEADRFQYLAVAARPADEGETQEALREFIQRFVVKTKRQRAELFLLDPARRDRGIREVWAWLDPSKTEALNGSAGFPQHLAARFGALPGTYVDKTQSVHVTASEAAVLGLECGLFISADRSTALLFFETGGPTLCSDSKPKPRDR